MLNQVRIDHKKNSEIFTWNFPYSFEEMRFRTAMIKKTRFVLLSITIIILVVSWNFFFKYIRPIKVDVVDKITISRSHPTFNVGSVEITISDGAEIEYIIGQINSFRYKRYRLTRQCLPHIYITVHFKEHDDIFILAMYSLDNTVFCYTERNGRRRAHFSIDGEELFNFAMALLNAAEVDHYKEE